MGFIIKAMPDEDFYVDWSEIVDCPLFWGDRTRMEVYLGANQGSRAAAPERFERADTFGTSSHDGYLDWDSGGFVLNNVFPREARWLPRKNLKAFCEALGRKDDFTMKQLTETIEIEEDS